MIIFVSVFMRFLVFTCISKWKLFVFLEGIFFFFFKLGDEDIWEAMAVQIDQILNFKV